MIINSTLLVSILTMSLLDQIIESMNIKIDKSPKIVHPMHEPKKGESEKKYVTNTDFYNEADLEKVYAFINKYSTEIEIEASFGVYNDTHFFPGVKSIMEFNNLKSFLDSSKYEKEYMADTVYIADNLNIRKIVTANNQPVYQKKIRSEHFENKNYGIRISSSSEEFIRDGKEFEQKWNENGGIIRERMRWSYIPREKNKYSGVSIDLTIVDETKGAKKRRKYEVEVELKQRVKLQKFVDLLKMIYNAIQGNDCVEQIIDVREQMDAVEKHNSFFKNDERFQNLNLRKNTLYTGYWNKPVNIKIHDILDQIRLPSTTIKLNGRRMFVMIVNTGVYCISHPYEVKKIALSNGNQEYANTLIDCENIKIDGKNYIYGFDILFFKGTDIRNYNFNQRKEDLLSIYIQNIICEDIEFKHKEYFDEGKSFYENVISATDKLKNDDMYTSNPDVEDGLIFQSFGPYINKNTYKWKPPEKLTIDFKVSHREKETYNLKTSEDKIFTGTQKHPFIGTIQKRNGIWNGQKIDGQIIECKWNSGNKTFDFVRYRYDRDKPNNMNTAKSVWDDINNPISIKTLQGYTLEVMRKYHNRVKEKLIRAYVSGVGDTTIIDVGSGRGGDLMKWKKAKISQVFAIEPDKKNIKEMKERMQSIDYPIDDIDIINAGIQDTEKIVDELNEWGYNNSDITAITAFFSLTYLPQNQEIYNKMLKTIDLLPPGGKVIGAVLDGQRTGDLILKGREEEGIDEKFTYKFYSGSKPKLSAFSIEQISEILEKPFGNEIKVHIYDESSMVKNQTEYLFYFSYFSQKLQTMGFKLVYDNYLDVDPEVYNLSEQAKLFSGLNRCFVFQRKIAKAKKVIVRQIKFSQYENVINPYSDNLYRYGIKKPTFLNALIYCLDPYGYEGLAKRFIDLVKEHISIDLLKSLENGGVYRKLVTGLKGKNKDKEALNKYISYISSSDISLNEKNFTELISQILKISIYILDAPSGNVSTFHKDKCNKIYGHSKSVILYKMENDVYYPVAEKDEDEYNFVLRKNKLIEELNKIIC